MQAVLPSTATASSGSVLLAWLENAMLAERQGVAAVLSERHAALLKDLAPQIQALEDKISCLSQHKDMAAAKVSTAASLPMHLPHYVEDVTNDDGISSSQFKEVDALENHRLDDAGAGWTMCQPTHPKPGFSVGSFVPPGGSDRDAHGTGDGRHAWISRIVTSWTFEFSFAMLIVLNTLVMAIEAQSLGLETEYKLQNPDSDAREIWPGARAAFSCVEVLFGSLFTVEVVLKVVALRSNFLKECWNIVDTIIVVAWLVSLVSTAQLPVDPLLPRLARLGRLLRLLRLIRTIKLLDSLYLMTTAIKGSVSALLWSVVLLAVVQLAVSIILQSLLTDYILDNSKPVEKRQEVFMFYGTFARNMLTMFEITLGNWMPPCRALVENVSEWYMLFSLTHKLVIGFAVVVVMTSVFIQETFKTAAMDDRIMMMTKDRVRKHHLKSMERLFKKFDRQSEGVIRIGIEEFREVIVDFNVQAWLSAMDLEVRDAGELFLHLDTNGDGFIDAHELVEGLTRMKGVARNYDIVGLMKNQSALRKQLQDLTVLVAKRLPG